MRRVTSPRLVSLALLVFTLAFTTWAASANRTESDRRAADQILTQLDSTSGPVGAAVARPVRESRRALARADAARAGGNEAHAQRLEGLGLEWAELARDLSRAVSVETDAASVQGAAADASLRVRRTRAMLDQLVARRSRAQAELKQLRRSVDAGAYTWDLATSTYADGGSKPARPPAKKRTRGGAR